MAPGPCGLVTYGPRASVSASGAGRTAPSWLSFIPGGLPHQTCHHTGRGEPDLRTCSLSPVRATSAQRAASRGRCFKLCVLLMELLLKSNPQFSRVSQTRPYFTGTHKHQGERVWRPRRPGTRWPLRTGLLLPPHPASLPAGPPASPPKSRPRTVVLTRGYRLEAPDASGSLVGPQHQTC